MVQIYSPSTGEINIAQVAGLRERALARRGLLLRAVRLRRLRGLRAALHDLQRPAGREQRRLRRLRPRRRGGFPATPGGPSLLSALGI